MRHPEKASTSFPGLMLTASIYTGLELLFTAGSALKGLGEAPILLWGLIGFFWPIAYEQATGSRKIFLEFWSTSY